MQDKKTKEEYRNIKNNLQNITLIDAYKNNMLEYLKLKYKNTSEDVLKTKLDKIIKDRFIDKEIDIVDHPRYGKSVCKTTSLYEYLEDRKKGPFSPSGVLFKDKKEKESLISTFLKESSKKRNDFKKIQLEETSRNNLLKASIYLLLQASTKIFNNSIFGAMGSTYSFLRDLPNFNAITTFSRQATRIGLIHTERMLQGNLLIRDMNDFYNYIIVHKKGSNKDKIKYVMDKFYLHYPTDEELVLYFKDSMFLYKDITEEDTMNMYSIISKLEPEEKAFIYYNYSLYSLIKSNKDFFYNFVKKLYNKDVPKEDDLEKIHDIDKDVLNSIFIYESDLVENEFNMSEAIKKYPNGVRDILSYCLNFESIIKEYDEIFQCFFLTDVYIQNVWEHHPTFVRKSVFISDTDSAIFTGYKTIDLLKDQIKFEDNIFKSYIHTVLVFYIQKTLGHVFSLMCIGSGIDEKDISRLTMKNEFYFPVCITTPSKKHYMGEITIQEGKLIKPKLEIKGLGLVGSNLPKITTNRLQTILKNLINTIEKDDEFSIEKILNECVDYEREIYDSLIKGERTYISLSSINIKENYKIPLSSNYFNYMFWDEVFARTYGNLELPNKALMIPVNTNKHYLESINWDEDLRNIDPELIIRKDNFFEKYNREISNMLISPHFTCIPDIFIKIMDIRKIIYTNNRPFYLLLRSMGLVFNESKMLTLFSDFSHKKNRVII